MSLLRKPFECVALQDSSAGSGAADADANAAELSFTEGSLLRITRVARGSGWCKGHVDLSDPNADPMGTEGWIPVDFTDASQQLNALTDDAFITEESDGEQNEKGDGEAAQLDDSSSGSSDGSYDATHDEPEMLDLAAVAVNPVVIDLKFRGSRASTDSVTDGTETWSDEDETTGEDGPKRGSINPEVYAGRPLPKVPQRTGSSKDVSLKEAHREHDAIDKEHKTAHESGPPSRRPPSLPPKASGAGAATAMLAEMGLGAEPSSPATKSPAAGADPSVARANIVKELVDTEHNYLKCLIMATKVYLVPMRTANVVEPKEIEAMFGNLEALIGFNTHLFGRLDARHQKWGPNSTIGDAMLGILEPTVSDQQRNPEDPKSEFVAAYCTYMQGHARSILTVNQLTTRNTSFARIMSETKTANASELNGLDLLAILIMPVQRILRYRLLLIDLLKHTEQSHPDHPHLKKCLAYIEKLASDVNDAMREQDSFEKMNMIEESFVRGRGVSIVAPGRSFVREGLMLKASRRRDQERWFFLFSDVLVYASIPERAVSSRFSRIGGDSEGELSPVSSTHMSSGFGAKTNKRQYVFHRMVNLVTTQVRPEPSRDSKGRFHFSILTTEEKSFVVSVATAADRDAWLRDLDRCISNCKATNPDLTLQPSGAAPVWVQDKDVKSCHICDKKFHPVTLRRHHCRNCGHVVCDDCSSFRMRLAHVSDKAVRVCSACWKEQSNEATPKTREPSKRMSTGLIGGGLAGALGSTGAIVTLHKPTEHAETAMSPPPIPKKTARTTTVVAPVDDKLEKPVPGSKDSKPSSVSVEDEIRALRARVAELEEKVAAMDVDREKLVAEITAAVLKGLQGKPSEV